MKHSKLIFLVALSMTLLLATACSIRTADATIVESAAEQSTNDDEHEAEEEHDENDVDMAHGHVEPPEAFASLINTFVDDQEAIEVGEETYNTLCATCHGPEGKGDGPGATELDPKPADLSDGVMMSDLSDGYLFWRVTKGGAMEPFNSAMPAWEEGLTEEQRWQIIAYIRTLSKHQDNMEETDDGHADGDEHGE